MSEQRPRPPAGEVSPAADLVASWSPADGFLFEHGGAGFATRGASAEIIVGAGDRQPHRVADAAQALLARRPAGAPDIVVAAVPFDGEVAARAVVPASVTRRERRGPVAMPPEPAPAEPCGVTRAAEPDAADFVAAVAAAVSRIRRGELRKVVLARSLVLDGPGWDATKVIRRLRAADPDAYTLATRGCDGRLLIAATPELLVRRTDGVIFSRPLAGSAPRSSDPATDRASAERLLRSAKDRSEHGPVVDAVADALAPYCRRLQVDETPHLVATANVWHLASNIVGEARPGAPDALHLAAALHPTPAVCGTPTAAALGVIREVEPVPRGLYSGIAGWVDERGDGEWVVVLRCASIDGGRARLHAGAGIVAASDPDAELAETETKFRALLTALGAATSRDDIAPDPSTTGGAVGAPPDADTAA